ncbi:hypothetical protein BT63DRAFT_468929 [Microthyrium microscopicum]|uniref:Uncharacterized protein n=1 Tax=Microthyrium microscopicum TaxID=703497 RepID=A0A6A6UFX6_9PEZI|nr:hypothetical protein BT63DRAFT_468929 [Microthyrium microscopicum]
MKTVFSLSILSILASQALACVHFEGGIQQGGINHGIWINKFEDDGHPRDKHPCKGPSYLADGGWFDVKCVAGTRLLVSPNGGEVKYSYDGKDFHWTQATEKGKGDSIGACEDRRGACGSVGHTFSWKVVWSCK